MTSRTLDPSRTNPVAGRADWLLTESLDVRHELQRGARAGTSGRWEKYMKAVIDFIVGAPFIIQMKPVIDFIMEAPFIIQMVAGILGGFSRPSSLRVSCFRPSLSCSD